MATASVRYAGFWRRYLASSLDVLLFALLEFGIRYIFHQQPFVDTAATSARMMLFNFFWPKILSVSIILVSWLWSDGQTIGKWLMRIRIVKEDRSRMDLGTGILRICGYVASSVMFSIGYLWMLIDAKKQTWHDKIANTYVIDATPTRPPIYWYIVGFILPPLVYISLFIWILFLRGVVDSPSDFRAFYDSSRTVLAPKFMKQDIRVHYEKSREYMKQARAMDPKAPGYMKELRPIVRQAIEELKLARKIDVKNSYIHNEMGKAFDMLDGEDAMQNAEYSYRAAVQWDDHNSLYSYHLGLSLYKLKRYEDAVKFLNDAIEQNDDNAAAYHVLGMTYAKLKNVPLAKRNYELAIAEYKQANKAGRNDKVIADVERMLKDL